MLRGIFRLVNISRSAAFLFRYCYSSCASSSPFKKTQNFYQTISFQENRKKMTSAFLWALLVSTWSLYLLVRVSVKGRHGWPMGLLLKNGGASNEVGWRMRNDVSLSLMKERRVEKGEEGGTGMPDTLLSSWYLLALYGVFVMVCLLLFVLLFWEREDHSSPFWSPLWSHLNF